VSASDCIFCKIVRGELAGTIVHRDEQTTAFRDLRPVAPTHILIVPNAHIASIDAAGGGDEPLLGHLFSVARELAGREGLSATGYRVVVNHGPAAGQSVFHVHMHLIGGRALGWPPG
jgi:histidine triad (HIT) family protein